MHGITKSQKLKLEQTKETKQKEKLFSELKQKYKLPENTSKENLKLNTEILNISSQDYQFWNDRKSFLIELFKEEEEQKEKLIEQELLITQKLLPYNSKCYSIWYHRKWIVNQMKIFNLSFDYEYERKLCSKMINYDSRNFHCWEYLLKLCFI